MEKEYVIQIAQTIQEQLIGLTPMPVLMSWGIAEFAATIFQKTCLALRIKSKTDCYTPDTSLLHLMGRTIMRYIC